MSSLCGSRRRPLAFYLSTSLSLSRSTLFLSYLPLSHFTLSSSTFDPRSLYKMSLLITFSTLPVPSLPHYLNIYTPSIPPWINNSTATLSNIRTLTANTVNNNNITSCRDQRATLLRHDHWTSCRRAPGLSSDMCVLGAVLSSL